MVTTSLQAVSKARKSTLKAILVTGFTAGTLDILAATISYSFIRQKGSPVKLLQSIASSVFGQSAFQGGWPMAFCGLAFHYLIAFSFAITYFFLFPYIPFLRKQKIIAGLLYGVVVWLIMNLVVLPIVFPKMPSLQWATALTGMGILMVCIGLPISVITQKYYSKKYQKENTGVL